MKDLTFFLGMLAPVLVFVAQEEQRWISSETLLQLRSAVVKVELIDGPGLPLRSLGGSAGFFAF